MEIDKNENEINNEPNQEANTEVNIDEISKANSSVDNNDSWGDMKEERTVWKDAFQWVRAIAIALVIAYLINVFVFERAKVDGDSMLPTLHNEESLFEYKLGYLFGTPKRGEIIILEYEKGKYDSRWVPYDSDQVNYVKRVVALPGETIDLKDGHVYINGKRLIEPYIDENVRTLAPVSDLQMEKYFEYPYTIPENEYFVLGDNREHSKDSRFIGSVDISRIRGKVGFVMYPFDQIRFVNQDEPYFEGE